MNPLNKLPVLIATSIQLTISCVARLLERLMAENRVRASYAEHPANMPLRSATLRAATKCSIVALPFLLTTAAMFAQSPGTLVVLNTMWRDNISGDLRFTTFSPTERDSYTIEGSVYYFANASQTSSSLMYRLYSSPDHMDSNVAGEGGYTTQEDLGYAWNSQLTAMDQVTRGYDSNVHHALISPNETLAGYTIEGFSLYAYARYGDGAPTSTSPTHLVSLSVGGIAVESNSVSGGAVWSLVWNGEEYLNSHDYGRLMQTALFSDPNTGQASVVHSGDVVCNPTEGGSSGYISSSLYHNGSPCVSLYNSGDSQISSCVPLDFAPPDFGGTFDENPVIWQGMTLGKTITLDFGGLGPVAHYQTQISLPVSLTTGLYDAGTPGIVIPAIYLTAAFDTFYSYDPSTSTQTTLSVPAEGDLAGASLSTGQIAVIACDPTTSNCIGLYVASTANGGSASTCAVLNANDGSGTSPSSNATYLIYAQYYGNIASGSSTFSSYIACGTLSDVESYVDTLYADGDK